MFDGGNIFSHFWSPTGGVLAQFTPSRMNFLQLPDWTNNLSVFLFVPDFGIPFVNNEYENPWLFDGLLTPGGNLLNSNEPGNRNNQRAMRVFQRTRIAVGYYEEGLFHARLQFAGANPRGLVTLNRTVGGEEVPLHPHEWRVGLSAPSFNAAFAWLGTPNLVIDAGVRSWLPVSNWVTDTWNEDLDTNAYIRMADTGTYWGGIGFGIGASYSGLLDGALTLNARLDGGFLRGWRGTHEGMDTVIRNPMQLSAQIWPRYTLPGGQSIMFSAGLNYLGRNFVEQDGENVNDREGFRDLWDRSNRLRMGMGVAFEMPIFRGGWVNIGLTYRHGTRDTHGGEANVISLPVLFFFNW